MFDCEFNRFGFNSQTSKKSDWLSKKKGMSNKIFHFDFGKRGKGKEKKDGRLFDKTKTLRRGDKRVVCK
jgi:hypothetical protein